MKKSKCFDNVDNDGNEVLKENFIKYMKEHLMKANDNMKVREEVVFHLTNGTKIIPCPLLGAVTYFDKARRNKIFR